jgi:restriction system protein
MPRRAEKPILEEFAEEFENLPARAGLLVAATLALIGWFLPTFFPLTGLSIAGSLAIAGRYLLWLLAFMVLASTGVGAARRWFDARRFDSGVKINDLTWDQFEGYLAEYFRRRGASVVYRGGAGADGGVDLVLDDVSGRRVVQAKHWKTRRVGVVPLRALWGVIGDEKAQGAVFVTSGTFTREATEFAEGKRLELIDGNRLRQLLSEMRPTATATAPAPALARAQTCPQCGRGVLERKLARRGAHAGSYFLGCSAYPTCRYTANL